MEVRTEEQMEDSSKKEMPGRWVWRLHGGGGGREGENLSQDRLPGGAATIHPERRWKKKMSKTKAERK